MSDEVKKSQEEKDTIKDSEIVNLDEEVKKEKEKEKEIKEKNDFLKKKKIRGRIIKGVIAVILILAIVIVSIRLYNGKKIQDLMANMQTPDETATVEQRDLNKSVSGTGTLYSNELRTLSTILQSSSKITAVNVKIGDWVEKDQVLVTFSTEDINKDISNLNEDIATQKKQDALESKDSERNYVYSYTTASTSLSNSNEKVERALEEVHKACNEYGDAKQKYKDLEAERDEKLEDAHGNEKDTITETYKTKLESQQKVIDSAYQAQEKALQSYSDAVASQADTAAKTQNDLSSADSTYEKSNITKGSKSTELKRKMEDLQDSLDNYVVKAPISGIVTQIDVSEGNSFEKGTVLTIQDTSKYTVSVKVDEYDITSIRQAYKDAQANGGQVEVIIKTEATDDKEFKGHVSSIAPTSTTTATESTSSSGSQSSGSSSSSTASFEVTIDLDETDDALMIGMTAKVAIIVDKAPSDAFIVPYDAVVEEKENTDEGFSTSKYYVNVVEGSVPGSDKFDKPANPNDIVIEDETGSSDKNFKPAGKPSGKSSGKTESKRSIIDTILNTPDMSAFASEEIKTKKIEVTKVFDTDFYSAVKPVNAGDLEAGDTVTISDEDSKDGGSSFGGGPGGMSGGPGGGGGPRM